MIALLNIVACLLWVTLLAFSIRKVKRNKTTHPVRAVFITVFAGGMLAILLGVVGEAVALSARLDATTATWIGYVSKLVAYVVYVVHVALSGRVRRAVPSEA